MPNYYLRIVSNAWRNYFFRKTRGESIRNILICLHAMQLQNIYVVNVYFVINNYFRASKKLQLHQYANRLPSCKEIIFDRYKSSKLHNQPNKVLELKEFCVRSAIRGLPAETAPPVLFRWRVKQPRRLNPTPIADNSSITNPYIISL